MFAKDLNIPEDAWEDVVVPPTDLWSDQPPEVAQEERRQRKSAQARVEQESQRAEALAAQLRELGIELNA